MGDVAQGIKAFKKGMTEDEAAKADASKTEPVKTIDHQAAAASQPSGAAADRAAQGRLSGRHGGRGGRG